MTRLTAGDLARMQRFTEELMPDTCTIQVPTYTTSDYGASVTTWASTYTDVACRVGRMTEPGRVMGQAHGEQPQEVSDWIVTLEHDQVVALGYRIVTDARTLEIVDINADKSYKAATRVLCREVVTG